MPRDWNTVEDSDQDSDQNQLNNQQQQTKEQTQSPKDRQAYSKKQQTQTKQENKKAEGSYNKQRPKFLSDQELIQKIKAKQIQQRKKIKVVNCKSEELVAKMQKHPLISYWKEIKVQDKPSFYIANFKTQQDLVAFIEQKISNKYRFFLHPYIKTARDIQREKQYAQRKRQKEDDYYKEKDRYTNRKRQYDREDRGRQDKGRQDRGRQQNRRGRNRPEYDEQSQQKKQKSLKKQKKYEPKRDKYPQQDNSRKRDYDNTRRRQPPKDRGYGQQDNYHKKQPSYSNNNNRDRYPQKQKYPQYQKPRNQPIKQSTKKSQYNYQIQKNIIYIKQNIYSKNRIVDEIVSKKIVDKWNKIKIYVKRDGLEKVLQLAELIYKRIEYGLKELPDESKKNQNDTIEVILEYKCHVIHPNSEYRLLTSNQKKYFEQIGSRNKYIISKQFSIDEYVKSFKYYQKDICKKWDQWIIKAQDENIPMLLKLSWKLRKELFLNIGIKVGARKEIPWTILEIQPETDKDKRPKVDTSFVNSYLTN